MGKHHMKIDKGIYNVNFFDKIFLKYLFSQGKLMNITKMIVRNLYLCCLHVLEVWVSTWLQQMLLLFTILIGIPKWICKPWIELTGLVRKNKSEYSGNNQIHFLFNYTANSHFGTGVIKSEFECFGYTVFKNVHHSSSGF